MAVAGTVGASAGRSLRLEKLGVGDTRRVLDVEVLTMGVTT